MSNIAEMLRNLSQSDSSIQGKLYFIENTLVHPNDGCRIIGPLQRGMLEFKRKQYESITKRMSDEERKRYPFIVYELNVSYNLKRIE